MPWKTPNIEDLSYIAQSATESLHICSPFITRPGIDILSKSLPHSISRVEIWTKFDSRDWITGASEPDSLLEFIETLTSSPKLDIRISDRLHAKFIMANEHVGIAGSANLTRGGFGGNIEITQLVGQSEINDLANYINTVRGELSIASLDDLRKFVSRCHDQAREKEALLDLIREALPEPGEVRRPIRPISQFIDFLAGQTGYVVEEIRTIYFNQDRNNRTGHLKQGYYAVQRFFQENPGYIAPLSQISLAEAYNIREQQEIYDTWLAFFRESDEADEDFAYNFSILRGYLTANFGGHRTGGGGGDYPFRLVWTPVARMMSQ